MIRSGTIVYPGVRIGENFETGHYALIRGEVVIGDDCRLGSYSSIEGKVTVGDGTVIRGRCEIPNSTIGKRCQIYAGVMFYDTPQPPDGPNLPPVIEDDVVIGCNAAVLGGVTVGARSFVAAHAFVTRDVPPDSYVKRSGEIVPRR